MEKRCSTDDVTHTNAFTFALKENFIISNEDDVIELVNAALMFASLVHEQVQKYA